jgi:hypothetical protein
LPLKKSAEPTAKVPLRGYVPLCNALKNAEVKVIVALDGYPAARVYENS